MYRKLSLLFVVSLLVLGIGVPTVINAQGCTFLYSISNSYASGDLKNCGYGGDNSVSFSGSSNGNPISATVAGTHGGYNLSGSGNICVKGTSNSLPGGSEEHCQDFGSGQSAPPAQNNPPPSNGGGNPPPAQSAAVPFIGQQNQPGGNWVKALAEPTNIYANSDPNSQVVAQMHAGWFYPLNAYGNGWTQLIVNGRLAWIQDGNGQSERNVGGAVQAPAGNSNPPANNTTGGNAYAKARQGDGGLNMIEYCGVSGQRESNDGQHVYSWGCDGTPINPSVICQNAWPDRPYPRAVGGLAGLSCHTSPQTVETAPSGSQPPANSGGGSGNSNGTGSTGGNTNNGGGNTSVTCNLPTHLVAGQEGHVLSSTLNIRNGAGTDFGPLVTMQKGDYFSVLSGPTCRQGYNWWYVSFMGRNGYIAEGLNGAYYAEPAAPLIVPVVPTQDPGMSLPSRELIAICDLNPYIYEYYKGQTPLRNLLSSIVNPLAPSKFLDLLSNLLTAIGVGVNYVSGVKDPLADKVTMYIYQRYSDGMFYYQMERALSNGQLLRSEITYSQPPYQTLNGYLPCSYMKDAVG